jgi:hypothetical protein
VTEAGVETAASQKLATEEGRGRGVSEVAEILSPLPGILTFPYGYTFPNKYATSVTGNLSLM